MCTPEWIQFPFELDGPGMESRIISAATVTHQDIENIDRLWDAMQKDEHGHNPENWLQYPDLGPWVRTILGDRTSAMDNRVPARICQKPKPRAIARNPQAMRVPTDTEKPAQTRRKRIETPVTPKLGTGSCSSPPSKEEWSKYRTEITELYFKKSLKELRKMMIERHKFIATEKMYKDNFRKWNLKKNVGGSVSQAVLTDVINSRQLDNDEHEVLVGGKLFKFSDVIRYLKRRKEGQHLLRLLDDSRNLKVTSAAEFAMRAGSNWIEGCLDNGTWIYNATKDNLISSRYSDVISVLQDRLLARFTTHVTVFCTTLNLGEFEEAEVNWGIAFSGINFLLRAEGPGLLRWLPMILDKVIIELEQPEIGKRILFALASEAKGLYGTEHPIYQFCMKMYELDRSELEGAILGILESFGDCYEKRLGLLNSLTINTRLDALVCDKDQYWTLGNLLNLRDECRKELPEHDIKTMLVTLTLIRHYWAHRRLEDAEKEAKALATELEAMDDSGSNANIAYMKGVVFSRWSLFLFHLSEFDEAIARKRQALQCYGKVRRWNSMYAGCKMLCGWLQALGRYEEAEYARLEGLSYMEREKFDLFAGMNRVDHGCNIEGGTGILNEL